MAYQRDSRPAIQYRHCTDQEFEHRRRGYGQNSAIKEKRPPTIERVTVRLVERDGYDGRTGDVPSSTVVRVQINDGYGGEAEPTWRQGQVEVPDQRMIVPYRRVIRGYSSRARDHGDMEGRRQGGEGGHRGVYRGGDGSMEENRRVIRESGPGDGYGGGPMAMEQHRMQSRERGLTGGYRGSPEFMEQNNRREYGRGGQFRGRSHSQESMGDYGDDRRLYRDEQSPYRNEQSPYREDTRASRRGAKSSRRARSVDIGRGRSERGELMYRKVVKEEWDE